MSAPRVARLLVNLAQRYQGQLDVRTVTINGDVGEVISVDGAVDLVIAFEVDDGLVAAIRLIRNPDKLTHIGPTVALQ